MQAHETVLLREAIDGLNVEANDTIIDATFGAGGHSSAIVQQLGSDGHLIGIDVDETALGHPLNQKTNTTLVHGNFRDLATIVRSLHITSVDGILADLGWRMEQFSGTGKGFSFRHDEPLLMTLGEADEYPFTAQDIVNEWDEAVLADIIYGYGEERYARRIANALVKARVDTPVKTSVQLADIVSRAVPARARHGKTHPATKTFQALRIAVNDELQSLTDFIEEAIALLHPEGRLVIITFHSLEDRIVKHAFRAAATAGRGSVLTRKPILPSSEELAQNPRARSAKLRVFSAE